MIEEPARAELGISRDEYAACNYIQTWSANPGNKKPGWCDRTKGQIAKFIGITERGVLKMMQRLEAKGLVYRYSKNDFEYRITELWFDTVTLAKAERRGEQSSSLGVNKVPVMGEQSSSLGVNKVHTHKEYNNEFNNDLNSIDIAAKPQMPLPNESKKIDGSTPNAEENPKEQKTFKGGAARKSDYLDAEISEVVEYLNEKVGLDPKNGFRKSKSTAAHIRQRIAENYTVDDIKAVIEHKCVQWANEPKWCQYLRPQTLFGTGKFEAYLIAARKWQNSGRPKQASAQAPTHSQRSGIAFLGGDKSIYQEEKQAF